MRISCDDGCASDLRVAELAKKYSVEAVFYWPANWFELMYSRDLLPLTIEEALKIAGEFEIGSHTLTHRHLTKLPVEEAKREILESKHVLEHMFNKPIKKFCPPRGYTNEELTEYTLKHYESQRLTRGKELVHIHPNSGANNNRPWQECINEDTEELWCHSWELDKYDQWDNLESYLRRIQ